MPIEFLSDSHGGTILRRKMPETKGTAASPETGGADSPRGGLLGLLLGETAPASIEPFPPSPPPRPQREILLFIVRLNKLEALATAYGLNDFRKARLALRLQRCGLDYLKERTTYKAGGDSAALKRLRYIEKQVGRLASLDWRSRDNMGAATAMIEAGRWSAGAIDVTNGALPPRLPLDEFDVYRWLQQAGKVLEIVHKAQILLEGSNSGGVAEAGWKRMLYGHRLPRIYEQSTREQYYPPKDRTGDSVVNEKGVRFVLMAAAAIGAPTIAPGTVAWHWNEAGKPSIFNEGGRTAKTSI